MPVSKKPRGPKRETAGPNPYTPAGTLLYSWYEHAAQRKLAGPTMEEVTRRARTSKRRKFSTYRAAAPAGSREAERRKRQTLTQHPSVIARFANHPTRAEIDAQIAKVEAA